MLVDSAGQPLGIDVLIERLRGNRIGFWLTMKSGSFSMSGIWDYSLKPTDSGAFLAQPVSEIARPRFSTHVLRKQIGATVLSVTSDAVFVVRDGNSLKKVRADQLEVGMVLASGEKVYR